MLILRYFGIDGGGSDHAVPRLLLAGAVLALLAGGLSACGKRGDPYRPSEVPGSETSTNNY